MKFLSYHLLPTCALLFSVLLVPNLSGSSASSTNGTCASFDCGNGVTISYPFWVRDGSLTYCGYPGLGVSCIDKNPVLRLLDDSYYVKMINYSQSTLTILQVAVMEQNCPRVPHNVTLDTSPLLNYSRDDGLLCFLYNCTSYPALSSPSSIECLRYGGAKHSFVFPVENIPEFDWHRNCEAVVAVPVVRSSFDGLTSSNFDEILREGFQLDWTPESNCRSCEASLGYCGYENVLGRNFICFCPDGQHPLHCNDGQLVVEAKTGLHPTIIIGVVITGILITFVIILFFVYKGKLSAHNIIVFRKNQTRNANVETFLENYGTLAPQRYKYSDIKKMTNSFKDKLGQGGYGGVFKGKLHDGRLVAIKILNESKGDGDEFINEVSSIGRTFHVNIVSLLGFCSDGSKRALIYEFMPNGSLEKYIYSEKPRTTHLLGWEKLYHIALGIARGLEYLHRGCSTRILHLDIKPHNILLDKDFCPKISDFGLAKLCPTKDSIVSILGTRGTVGYIAPEVWCRNFGGVSYKSDVYSYGMMVLEMVGGRKNIDARVDNTSEIYFPHWIYRRIAEQQGDMELGTFEDVIEEETAKKMILVGLWCIQTDPSIRP